MLSNFLFEISGILILDLQLYKNSNIVLPPPRNKGILILYVVFNDDVCKFHVNMLFWNISLNPFPSKVVFVLILSYIFYILWKQKQIWLWISQNISYAGKRQFGALQINYLAWKHFLYFWTVTITFTTFRRMYRLEKYIVAVVWSHNEIKNTVNFQYIIAILAPKHT